MAWSGLKTYFSDVDQRRSLLQAECSKSVRILRILVYLPNKNKYLIREMIEVRENLIKSKVWRFGRSKYRAYWVVFLRLIYAFYRINKSRDFKWVTTVGTTATHITLIDCTRLQISSIKVLQSHFPSAHLMTSEHREFESRLFRALH